jgi:hypothetical protein
MTTIKKAGHTVTIYPSQSIAERHSEHADALPEKAVGYIEVHCEAETDYNFDLVEDAAEKLIAGTFGPGYVVSGVTSGDEFANNYGTSDEEDGQWALIAVMPEE